MDRFRPSNRPAAVVITAVSVAAYPVGVTYLPTEPLREPARHAEVVPLDPLKAFPKGLGIEHASAFLPPPNPVERAAVVSYPPPVTATQGVPP